jgi:hypothetical protein
VIDDATIEAALGDTEIIPEFVEWYGNPEHRVTVRIEPHMGHYAEATLYPHMQRDDIKTALEIASDDLDRRRSA